MSPGPDRRKDGMAGKGPEQGGPGTTGGKVGNTGPGRSGADHLPGADPGGKGKGPKNKP